MRSREIRSSFLEYFQRQGHTVVPSSPLVPGDDPTLLFTNAGMNQFKDVFLGKEKRSYVRAASSQKCMRVSGKHNDLDNVGPSLRHHTFFEMLGNFSFGDYFKKDAIPFAWELLTAVWKLAPDRLYPTIFKGEAGIPRDDEAYDVWRRLVSPDRIGELGASDNFWAMGETGPCGRCSEIYYFRGAGIPCDAEKQGGSCRGLECDCDRYVEIWNNVFMEFDRQPEGTLNPLPARSIDTGMGLERVTAVIQGKLSNYDTDLFTPILNAIGRRARRPYGATLDEPADVSMRVIADHLRAMTFLIADGVVPSNEWRGYVLRKIMRRAMRHGKKLGFTDPVLHELVDVLVEEMGGAYPELKSGRDVIVRVVRSEEERFDAVLTSGLPKLEEALDRAERGNRILPGEDAFRLYDSLGVPLDFMEDLAEQRGLTLDRAGYERAMEGQRVKARAGSAFKGTVPEAWYVSDALQQIPEAFEGYDTTALAGAPVVELYRIEESGPVLSPVLKQGESGYVALARTPFYVEAGGQVSDVGSIEGPGGSADVTGVVRVPGVPNVPRMHKVSVIRGELRRGDTVKAIVHDATRDAIRRNHTATHLLHAALRQLLGSHVKQAGSLVAPDRLRFDFVHFDPLTAEQLDAVEQLVNEHIVRNVPIETEISTPAEAIGKGAMALFGEKYGDRVRVVTVPGFSTELCGGTHVRATGDIGSFVITEESGVAAGVRRIEAVTGLAVIKYVRPRLTTFREAVAELNAKPHELLDAIRTHLTLESRYRRERDEWKMKAALGGGAASDEPVDVSGVKLIAKRVDGIEKNGLRAIADSLRDRLGSGVVVLASQNEGKVALLVAVTKDLAGRVHAGHLVKELAPLVGGAGGGRPDLAEAGGKDPGRINDLLAKAPDALRVQLVS
jgi:alanyl-tRNA synthetase